VAVAAGPAEPLGPTAPGEVAAGGPEGAASIGGDWQPATAARVADRAVVMVMRRVRRVRMNGALCRIGQPAWIGLAVHSNCRGNVEDSR
jgi:hypothetical protein